MPVSEAQTWMEQSLDSVLATTARLLVRGQEIVAASILANADVSITLWDQNDWKGGHNLWRLNLAVPVDAYFSLEDRAAVEGTIDRAIAPAMEALSTSDFVESRIVTKLENDRNWRLKTCQYISGERITNQGRVRSDNIAARQHDGLLFRSRPETLFYDALKRAGVPFAPLPVIVKGGIQYKRIEPDFVIFYKGVIMVVEIDGDLYHTESPAAAHTRLKLLLDEGTRLERITAPEYDTPEKAREAVQRVMLTLEKLCGL
jgi:hypothetical protein